MRTQPVLGRLVSFLRLSLEPGLLADIETGAGELRLDPRYVEAASDAELRFWLAHAALHAALLHFDPPPGPPQAWSKACDAEVDRLLRALGFAQPVAGVTERHAWWGDAAGEGGEAAMPHAAGVVSEDRPAATQRLGATRQWRERARQAAGEALGAGQVAGELLRALLCEAPDAPAHDWRARLAAYVQRWHRAQAHFGRPSRRAVPPFLLPALRPAAAHILLAVDTSASIEGGLLDRFWAEIQALAGQIPMQLTLLAADSRLAPGSPWRFAAGEVPRWPAPPGQGGTDFRPVFEWLEQRGEEVDALLYFTDGKGDYPTRAPMVPVLWVLAGEGSRGVMPPFGEVVRI